MLITQRECTDMLIGFSDPDLDKRRELAHDFKNHIGNRATVYDTTDFVETVEILKKYSLYRRETRILVHPLQEIIKDHTEGMWRAAEYFYSRRGGLLFGPEPTRNSMAYRGETPKTLQDIEDFGYYHWQRALYSKKGAPIVYGRAYSDPHTLVIGYRPSWPKLSRYAEHTLAGLPNSIFPGTREEWWMGVSFFVPRSRATASEELDGVFDFYPYAARVTVTDTANEYLIKMGLKEGEDYQKMDLKLPRLPDDNIRYGSRLRELSRLDLERVVE